MSLDATKRLISRKYLGRGGVHGVGLSKADNAVRVHLSPPAAASDNDREELLEALRRDAAPYAVMVTTEDAATKTD